MAILDLRTDVEKKRDERYDKVVSEFKKLREKYPQYSDSRLMPVVGQAHGFSRAMVRVILKKNGIIK